MNPNSQHQIWSKWEFTVTPGESRRADLPLEEMKLNCARFAREGFGSTGMMNIQKLYDGRGKFWSVQILVEGVPVHDPEYRKNTIEAWAKFFRNGFGANTHTHCQTKRMAGDFQDGKPPEQLIIMPAFRWFGGEDKDSSDVRIH